ncbi:MAG: nitroreductase [Methanomassiliicoccus sp.]|nr:nitroreductase [Methanomassiliicoccus sp.]
MTITNEIMKNIYERRSVRAYADKSVPEDILQEIIKAGFHAPNGANTQGLRFAVITNRSKLKAYAEKGRLMSLSAFQKMNEARPNDMTANMVKQLSNPNNDIFYGAPAIVFVFATPACLTPVEDASLAAENMMLAAKSLGLGSCWIGFAKGLTYDPEFVRELNVPADHQLVAPIILGYPKKEEMRPSARGEPQVLGWLK